MIRGAWRRAVRFLGSAVFATSLLGVIGAWSMLGSLVPQGSPALPAVRAWAAAHPVLEPIVQALGLHRAYGTPFFLACVLTLGLSTALCAWQRTRSAFGRAKALRRAAAADSTSVAVTHDLEVAIAAASSGQDALSIASATLSDLGIKAKARDGVLVSVSPAWAVWGSPVFHWALLAIILVIAAGNLFRAEGLMGVAVGETKADVPGSYGFVQAGPLHDWRRVQRSIRVDAFDPAFVSDGIDRGPTPSVSLLDAAGNVEAQQLVYPNHTLKNGSLTIYPSDYGLSTTFSLVDTRGVASGSSKMLVDFSVAATSGTVPIDFLGVSDRAGNPLYRIFVTVPLDKKNGAFVFRVPARPVARVQVLGADGSRVMDRTLAVGEMVALPAAGDLRLEGVGYYARLSVVDDWSIPLLYAGLVVAMFGLAIAVVARQQIVLATVVDGPDGPRLAVMMRLWRNAASSRTEIEDHLASALGGVEKGSVA